MKDTQFETCFKNTTVHDTQFFTNMFKIYATYCIL